MQRVWLRAARPADAAAILDLFARSYAGQQRAFVRQPVDEARFRRLVGPDVRRHLRHFSILAIGRTVVGAIHIDGDRVEALVVSAAWQRRGLGRTLLARAMRGRRRALRLEAQAADPRARAFWAAMGFRPVRIVPARGLGSAPERFLVMRHRSRLAAPPRAAVSRPT